MIPEELLVNDPAPAHHEDVRHLHVHVGAVTRATPRLPHDNPVGGVDEVADGYPAAEAGSAPSKGAPRGSCTVQLYARAAACCGRPCAYSSLISKYVLSLESPSVPSM